MNFTLPLRQRTYREFSTRLKIAHDRIWITNAYLAPSAPILRRLKKAAKRGVDVRILLPRKSDVFFMPWVAGSYYKELIASGVRIYEYLPRFLHAKSVIIDDWVVVGSSNMNRRSMLKDFEVDIVLNKTESIHACLEKFEKDLIESEEIITARGGFTSLLGRVIISFMKNWI
jgi:cardiolipin synthase